MGCASSPAGSQVSWGALGYPGSLTAPWTVGCSSCLIIQSSQAGQSVEFYCMSLSGSPARSLETLSLSPCWLKVIRASRALQLLFELTFLLQLATTDATRLSIPQPREHPSCKMQFRCFHSDVSYAFPVCRKRNKSFEHFKPWSGSIWNCTLKEKHIPELETLTI